MIIHHHVNSQQHGKFLEVISRAPKQPTKTTEHIFTFSRLERELNRGPVSPESPAMPTEPSVPLSCLLFKKIEIRDQTFAHDVSK